MRQVKIFTGSSHPELAGLILDRLGLQAAPASLKRFANAETSVELETSVRDHDVFIIQSGSSAVNDHIMELLIMVNACKLASARRITVSATQKVAELTRIGCIALLSLQQTVKKEI